MLQTEEHWSLCDMTGMYRMDLRILLIRFGISRSIKDPVGYGKGTREDTISSY